MEAAVLRHDQGGLDGIQYQGQGLAARHAGRLQADRQDRTAFNHNDPDFAPRALDMLKDAPVLAVLRNQERFVLYGFEGNYG
ncbi:hypothetical protein Rmf_52330 [Roseomonas fluvialis]|uniref:Uncharacterized protein n=1 Tax=Roseomonas fluvialis TaxID=1750527 RepID=A0ABN6PCF4_9PROT|nr:hypothetical protein Rmf_52330 [Roseomonas fluvialis]